MADEQVKVDDPFGGGSLSPSSAWFDPREGAPPQVWPQASNTPTYLGSPCTDEGDSTPAVVAGSDTESAGYTASSVAAEAAREDANV